MISADVKDLIALFNRSDLTELSIERDGRKLFLRKGEAPELSVEVEPEPLAPSAAVLKAHMVGVFYWGKDKRAKPAVAVGQHVEKGQIIGFIEAMGIMNELEAERSGEATEIVAAAGQPVEYGQPIVVLQPD